jgi:hypothetical protein
LHCHERRSRSRKYHFRFERSEFLRASPHAVEVVLAPAILGAKIATFRPSELLEAVAQRREAVLRFRIILGCRHQHADAPHPLSLLRACHERPRSRRAAEQRDELAALHSITSSARASSVGGTVRPSILAVSALMTSSNLLACTTGKSAGLAPLRMRPFDNEFGRVSV